MSPVFYYAASLGLLFLIPLAKAHWQEINLPPLLAPVRLVINLVYLNLAAAFFMLVRRPLSRSFPRACWWVTFAVLAAALCAMHPVFSGDLMEYLVRGRILGIYHESPYGHVPAEFPGDLLYAHSTWKENPDSYGPLSVALETIPALFFPNSVKAMVWLEKLIFLGFTAVGIYFFKCLVSSEGRPDSSDRTVALFALNPLLWVSTVIDGHNDAVMLSLTIAAVYFLLRRKFSTSFLLWTAAFLVKYTVILILPFLAITAVRQEKEKLGKFPWAFIVREILVNSAVIFLAYWPLWAGMKTFLALTRASVWFYTNTLPYAIHQGLSFLGLSVNPAWLKYGLLGAFFTAYGYWLRAHAREKTPAAARFFRRICLVYLAFYVTITIPFGFHYLLWALPWLILSHWPLEPFLVTLYAFTGLYSYFKRMNYLILLAALIYGAVLFINNRRRLNPQALR